MLVQTPAGETPVLMHATAVIQSGTDGCEGACRWRGPAILIVPPAGNDTVLAHPAGVGASGTDGHEGGRGGCLQYGGTFHRTCHRPNHVGFVSSVGCIARRCLAVWVYGIGIGSGRRPLRYGFPVSGIKLPGMPPDCREEPESWSAGVSQVLIDTGVRRGRHPRPGRLGQGDGLLCDWCGQSGRGLRQRTRGPCVSRLRPPS